jgi:small subunit ribosomal protein S6
MPWDFLMQICMSKTKKTSEPHYELLYIISNKFTEEEVVPLEQKVEALITANDGQITFRENWGKKRLAYPIDGFTFGYYRYIEFDLLPEKTSKLERSIRLMHEVLRHQIIKRAVRTVDLPEKPKPLIMPEPKEKKETEETKEVVTETEAPKPVEKPKPVKDTKASMKELDEKLDRILETDDLL